MAAPSALDYPFAAPPEPGFALEVAPGVHWVRMPLPFALNHVNLWLLEDGDGWTIVDCGIGNDTTRGLWEAVLGRVASGRPVRRVIVTHCHPDHAGAAHWLCTRFGAELWMTQSEYLTAHAVRNLVAGYRPEAPLALFRANGLAGDQEAQILRRGSIYPDLVPAFPESYRRLFEGDRVMIGSRHWRVIVGYGHAPEHASLYCEETGLLISGDMLLPTISTNVSVWPTEPLGDPLRGFLESIERFRAFSPRTLVLPSHGLPFRGVQARVAQLHAHHADRLDALEATLARGPASANELLGVLFPRALDPQQTFFAMGETIAHLHTLYYAGRATRAIGQDGVARFSRAPAEARAAA